MSGGFTSLCDRLRSQLSAAEALHVGDPPPGCERAPPLNARGQRVLDWLRDRNANLTHEARRESRPTTFR